jgi:hypothetical protein
MTSTKFIFIAGAIFLIGSILLIVNNYDKINIDRNGSIVKMRIDDLPTICLGTKRRYIVAFSYNGKRYTKSMKGSFCQRHYVGELIDMKVYKESPKILFPHESALLNLISFAALGILGTAIMIIQWKKIRK